MTRRDPSAEQERGCHIYMLKSLYHLFSWTNVWISSRTRNHTGRRETWEVVEDVYGLQTFLGGVRPYGYFSSWPPRPKNGRPGVIYNQMTCDDVQVKTHTFSPPHKPVVPPTCARIRKTSKFMSPSTIKTMLHQARRMSVSPTWLMRVRRLGFERESW